MFYFIWYFHAHGIIGFLWYILCGGRSYPNSQLRRMRPLEDVIHQDHLLSMVSSRISKTQTKPWSLGRHIAALSNTVTQETLHSSLTGFDHPYPSSASFMNEEEPFSSEGKWKSLDLVNKMGVIALFHIDSSSFPGMREDPATCRFPRGKGNCWLLGRSFPLRSLQLFTYTD